MRRRPPGALIRLRSGLKAGTSAFVTSSGVVGTAIGALSATGTVFPLWSIGVAGAGCATLGVAVTLIRGRRAHLPDQVFNQASSDGTYVAGYCTEAELSNANALTRPYYRHEYVADAIAESWRLQNPKGFVAIRNRHGTLCGSFGILALEASFLKQFIKGRVRDNDLEAGDILASTDLRDATDLYISGVVVRDPESPIGNRRACVMVWAMVEYVRALYGFRKRRHVYALAVSHTSENLLKGLGFSIATPAVRRLDKLNLYSLEVSKDSLTEILSRVGDYSPMCNCKY